jgi:hypothetical protein
MTPVERCRAEIARCMAEIYRTDAEPSDQLGAFRGLGDWQKELDILEGRAVSIGGKVYE